MNNTTLATVSISTQPDLDTLRQQAERAAAANDHSTAVTAYSAALALLPEPPSADTRELVYDLLLARSACYRDLNDYPAAEADLAVSVKLAQELGDFTREVEAIFRQLHIANRQGTGVIMRPVIEAMLERAQTLGDRLLEATALAARADIEMCVGDFIRSQSDAEAALAIFQAHNNYESAARLHWLLGAIGWQVGDLNAGHPQPEVAMAVPSAPNHRSGRANALNVFGNHSTDKAHRRDALRQALGTFTDLGNRERQAIMALNLSEAYLALGLYNRAAAYQEQTTVLQDIEDYATFAYVLHGRGKIALAQGHATQAAQLLHEARGYAQTYSDQALEADCVLVLGQAALVQGNTVASLALLQEAAQQLAALSMEGLHAMALAWLGAAHLKRGTIADALAVTTQAGSLLEAGADSNEYAMQEVWWWRYQALRASIRAVASQSTNENQGSFMKRGNPNDRARNGQHDDPFFALEQACALMLQKIANLSDPGLRRNYLNKVAINREIVLEWSRQARARNRSLAPLLEYSAPEGSLQQQLTRMLETGTRLAAQRDPDALPQFIVDEFVELSGAEHTIFVRFPDGANGAFDVVLTDGVVDAERESALALAQPLIQAAANSRQAVQRPAIGVVPAGDVPELHLRSAVAMPLVAQGALQAVLYGDVRQIFGSFTQADIDLIALLGNQAAAALENANWSRILERRVEERTAALQTANASLEQRNVELATVNRIGQALSSELELNALVELVGEQMRQIFAADIVYVALHNRQSELIQFPYVFGEELTPQRYGEGLTSHIITTGQPLLLNEAVSQRGASLGVKPIGRDVLSYLGVPIMIGDTAIGVISVQSTTHEGRFDKADVHLLSTVAANVGVAIQNAQLYQEISHRASEMAALAEVGHEISASLELATVLERIAAHAKNLLHTDTSAVYLPEHGGRVFRATTVLGDSAEAIQADAIMLGQGIIGDLARRGAAQIIHNTSSDPRVRHIPGTAQSENEQLMVAPLLAGSRVSGVMAVWRTSQSSVFTDSDLQFLIGLARQAAIAIENARLFQAAHDAQLAAEQANTAKSAFLANMSHELRTPLNAIIGFTRIVRRKAHGSLPEKQVENLDKVLVSADHLLGLINTVLDIAKIEAGRMDVLPATFNAVALADICLTTAQPLLRPGVSLVKAVEDDLPPLFSDPDKVKQILLNLLSNATKFTHTGTITLRVRSKAPQPNADASNMVTFEVIDSGIGISPEGLERIFEEFQQADSSTTRKYGGTGLGLSISRHLARLLGGDLTATSTEGVGSTFSLTLPLHYGEQPAVIEATQPETAPQENIAPSTKQPVVLAIDDDPNAIELLQENLVDTGYQVVGVRHASEGVQKAKELQPYAITLDVMMPEKDGWQVLYELKADPATRDIPVILVTIVDKKALGYQLGANDYLVKPLDRDMLLASLGRLTRTRGVAPTRLLIVDDDPDVLDLMRQQLVETSYELDTATDGIAALEAIAQRQPDVVLLDLMLPRMDGFGVIEHVRQHAELASIPIVVLTAKSLNSEEAALLRSSVSQVIQKQGLEGEKLIGALQRALQHAAA